MKAILKKLKWAVKKPDMALSALLSKKYVSLFFSDKLYLKIQYSLIMKKKLDFNNPQTFNEKMQWIKLYDRNPSYTLLVDKHAVRKYVTEKIGEEYLIPLLGVWSNPDEIDFDSLPEQFVLKCNHNSGLGACFCKNKSKLNVEKTKENLRKGLNQNYYLLGREWPYKNVSPKIIAEKYMKNSISSDDEDGMVDYKFYCFNGKAKFAYISQNLDNLQLARISYVTLDAEAAPFKRADYRAFDVLPPKTNQWKKMLELAEVLSKGIPFVRVDFYDVDDKIYFGELTFFPGGGYTKLYPEEWDYKLGQLISLNTVDL